MKTSIHTIILILIGLPVLGQSGTTLSGAVQETGGKPLPFATVALFTQTDTTRPAKATATDADGRYAFGSVRTGLYVVRATAVGFQKMQSALVSVATLPVELPALTLSEATGQLNAVQVVAKKPFIEQQIDRMVVNVAGSIVGSGSTALEVLEKSPGVTVDYQNDRLQLRGKDGVIIQ
ncbi:MAG: carboxypeptidase regulatory-like domain-containing protein, partial [Spirosoma sp.]|nr:carboxypeptidase regulatory-like domain-containing protein [Spirosoma sp.]